MAQTIQQAIMHTHLEGRRLLPFKTRKGCLNLMCSSTLCFSVKVDYIIIEKGYSQIILLKLFPFINGLWIWCNTLSVKVYTRKGCLKMHFWVVNFVSSVWKHWPLSMIREWYYKVTPGIGTTSSPWCRTHAKASWAGLHWCLVASSSIHR
jgi:hypothetical protein